MSDNQFADPQWRYFVADPDSEATHILDGIEQALEEVREAFTALENTLPRSARIVAFAEEGYLPHGHGVAFNGSERVRKRLLPDTDWEQLFRCGQDLICRPAKGTEKEQLFSAFTKRLLAEVATQAFPWKLGDGGEENNAPSLAFIPYDVNGPDSQVLPGPEAAHFDGGYLIRVPVQPEKDAFYCPPHCRLLSAEELAEQMGSFSFSDLPRLKTEALPKRTDSYDCRVGIKLPSPTAAP